MSAHLTLSERVILAALAAWAPYGLTWAGLASRVLERPEQLAYSLDDLIRRGLVNREKNGTWLVYTLAAQADP